MHITTNFLTLLTLFCSFAFMISEIGYLLLPSCNMTEIMLKQHKSLNNTTNEVLNMHVSTLL